MPLQGAVQFQPANAISKSRKAALLCRRVSRNRTPSVRVLCQSEPPRKPSIQSDRRRQSSLYKKLTKDALKADAVTADAPPSTPDFKDKPLPQHKQLQDMVLPNGLYVVILPNKTPPGRFEAHLEVHVGSVDESSDEMGLAHVCEHVTFLGSHKREMLLGNGCRSNAYTDFHHTVFHWQSPIGSFNDRQSGRNMMYLVLDALTDVAFEAKLDGKRIEKERLAVLAEAQMMNTIAYRLDCKLLQYLHTENHLSDRFPIGSVEQVKNFKHEQVRSFWGRHYYPANATLYIVGDFADDLDQVYAAIQKTVGRVPQRPTSLTRQPPFPLSPAALVKAQQQQNVVDVEAVEVDPHGPVGRHSWLGEGQPQLQFHAGDVSVAKRLLTSDFGRVRPPVPHKFGFGEDSLKDKRGPVHVFQHPLLHNFNMQMYCKLPLRTMSQGADAIAANIARIICSAFQFRTNLRYSEGVPAFQMVELDISDSAREGCQVLTLSVVASPQRWREAVSVALQEVRRLQKFGLSETEFNTFVSSMALEAQVSAKQGHAVSSDKQIVNLMETITMRHTFMEAEGYSQVMIDSLSHITLKDVNEAAKSLLCFASHYGREQEVLEEARESEGWGQVGPTRTTSIILSVPLFEALDQSSQDKLEAAAAAAASESSGLSTGQHLDIGDGELDMDHLTDPLKDESLDSFAIPEGCQRFNITGSDLEEELSAVRHDVTPYDDVQLIDNLVDEEQVQSLVEELKPSFITPIYKAYAHKAGVDPTEVKPQSDPDTGITLRRLSNGLRIVYRYTKNEVEMVTMRISALGGRAAEPEHNGPDGYGCMRVATATFGDTNRLGKSIGRAASDLFVTSNLLDVLVEVDEEYSFLEIRSPTGSPLEAAFQLLHLKLKEPVLEKESFERVLELYNQGIEQTSRTLEGCTMQHMIKAMMGQDNPRQLDPAQEQLNQLQFEDCRDAFLKTWQPNNMELIIVGDVSLEEVEQLSLKYLGTVESDESAVKQPMIAPVYTYMTDAGLMEKRQLVHLADSDCRGVGYAGGQMIPRWGPPIVEGQSIWELDAGAPSNVPVEPPRSEHELLQLSAAAKETFKLQRRSHPLFRQVAIQLMVEVINSRLFYVVRDVKNLTYDVNMELMVFDWLNTALWQVHANADPDKLVACLSATLQVLRDFKKEPFLQSEVCRARNTLLSRHEAELKNNLYHILLLQHIQRDEVPYKGIESVRDVSDMVLAVTEEDVNYLYNELKLDMDNIFTAMGISGPNAPDWQAMFYPLFDENSPKKQPAQAHAAVLSIASAVSKAFKGLPQVMENVAKKAVK